jgi:recombination protein RecR
MTTLEKLARLFSFFPGIGPRQSKRFVYFLLTRDKSYLDDLTKLIGALKKETHTCASCFRFFTKDASQNKLCSTCSNKSRNEKILMIVSRDVDFENMEKTSAFDGRYFVLGGTVPILEKEPEKKIRINELLKIVEDGAKPDSLKEIILAMNANPEGENTADYVKERISPLVKELNIRVSTLGRGLATGAELEYSDSETLKSALRNRQ